MRFILTFLMFFCWDNLLHASALQRKDSIKVQPKFKITLALKVDSSKIIIRNINEEAVKTYSKQKDFIYDDVAPQTLNWWDRFWNWLTKFIEKIFKNGGKEVTGFSKIFYVFLKWFLILSVIALVSFIIIKILGLDLKFLTGKSKGIEVPYQESLENIHEINFDEQLEAALLQHNYRLAVRLLYLKTLKQLSDQQLIDWKPEKTNQAYVLELTEQSCHQDFTNLTHKFEYIWYGEFFIDQHIFAPIHQSFQQFNQPRNERI